MTAPRLRLAVTLGDPRGIGGEVVSAALRDPAIVALADFTIIGAVGGEASPDVAVGEWSLGGGVPLAGRLAGLAIERAVALVQQGSADGIVTSPIDKAALLAGGYDYPGHTEMLAALTGAHVVMMLASERLRVVLATTHIPLRAVPDAVTRETLVATIRTTREALVRGFGLVEPRIALCALNPHGGDGGRFGSEDADVLAPAAREAGATGPFPADTVFVRAMRGEFDVVVAPYHDVGMTAIKVASFGHAVNVTLGLPFPRTSPDHGTALDIAGRGLADPGSMKEAIRQCAALALRLRRS